jgi:hypothetical protein
MRPYPAHRQLEYPQNCRCTRAYKFKISTKQFQSSTLILSFDNTTMKLVLNTPIWLQLEGRIFTPFFVNFKCVLVDLSTVLQTTYKPSCFSFYPFHQSTLLFFGLSALHKVISLWSSAGLKLLTLLLFCFGLSVY